MIEMICVIGHNNLIFLSKNEYENVVYYTKTLPKILISQLKT
jgi:hypothetical protein